MHLIHCLDSLQMQPKGSPHHQAISAPTEKEKDQWFLLRSMSIEQVALRTRVLGPIGPGAVRLSSAVNPGFQKSRVVIPISMFISSHSV